MGLVAVMRKATCGSLFFRPGAAISVVERIYTTAAEVFHSSTILLIIKENLFMARLLRKRSWLPQLLKTGACSRLRETGHYKKTYWGIGMKNALRTAVIAGSLMLGAMLPAQAGVLTWDLDGVKFEDGTTATGSIMMDVATHTVSTFSVSTTAGALSAFTFENSNSGLYFGGGAGPNNFILLDSSGRRYVNFSFTDALSATGGTFALNTASSYECMNCSPYRMVTAGTLTTVAPAAVPEPGTVALLVPALGMLGWMSRRRKKQAAR
jgi:hypothetical protein